MKYVDHGEHDTTRVWDTEIISNSFDLKDGAKMETDPFQIGYWAAAYGFTRKDLEGTEFEDHLRTPSHLVKFEAGQKHWKGRMMEALRGKLERLEQRKEM